MQRIEWRNDALPHRTLPCLCACCCEQPSFGGDVLPALLAITVAAAVATAMLNLYVEVQVKLRKEFRTYGANIVIVGKDGQALPADALKTVDTTLAGRG